jgi:hypothetical protein
MQNLSLVTWAVVVDKEGEGVSGKQVNNSVDKPYLVYLSFVCIDHKVLKLKLDKITSGIESTKTERKNFNDKLLDIEVQSLEKSLLFFAIDEHTLVENNPGNQGGATGVTENQGV